MSAIYVVVSIVAVATGLYEPGDWPHIFGTPLDADTVRKCWGYVLTIFLLLYPPQQNLYSCVWHQMFCRMFTSNSNFLARPFRLPPKRHIISNFTRSSLDSSTKPRTTTCTRISLKGRPSDFFVLQAVAITFEDALIAIASRLGYKESKTFKLIGFIWVFAWFAFTAPLYFDHQVRAQAKVDETNNFSLVRVLKSFCVAKFSQIVT